MVSKMTAARIPPAMTTVPADIRNPPHQPSGQEETLRAGRKGHGRRRGGEKKRRRKWESRKKDKEKNIKSEQGRVRREKNYLKTLSCIKNCFLKIPKKQ